MDNPIDIDEIIKKASDHFAHFLENNNNRKTHERFAILEEIYRNQLHFDAETLYIQMKKSAYRVSRATIYNTIEVLLECDLIIKHHFGQNVSLFERKLGFPSHHHMICTNCNSITEFEDQSIDEKLALKSSENEFIPREISLNIYGLCTLCHNK